MKVLQINTVYKEKSTGRTCFEVEKALQTQGHECYTAYSYGKSPSEYAFPINSKFEYYLHNVLSRLTGYQGYFSYFATKRLIRKIKTMNPDIIHLRNLHANYLNLPLLFAFLASAKLPVIQNLHDLWAITGKCAYYSTRKCYKWRTSCHTCPVIRQYPQSLFFDRTSFLHQKKKEWYAGVENLTVMGVSEWTADQAKLSFLKDRPISYIYNWINTDIFHPYQEDIRPQYNIPTDKYTIICVSASWSKGTPRYEDLLTISHQISKDMQIVAIGNSDGFCRQNIIEIPFVQDIVELAKLYSFGDVYVHFSIEDTFGKVIAEAMACGLPVITYDATACPEIGGATCGAVVPARDVNQMLQAIQKVRCNGKQFYSKTCIDRVNTNFLYENNIRQLIEIYNKLLKETL